LQAKVVPATTDVQTTATLSEETKAREFASSVQRNSELILQTGQANMAGAMQSFGKDWDAEKRVIARLRPDLLNQRWDITTDQGTIQVASGTMSAGDKAWLTGMLNQNANLVADTQTINTIMLSTFSGTTAMAASDPLGMTLTTLDQAGIDGSVKFLALLTEADTTSYYAAINPLKAGERYFKVDAPAGSVLNNPVVGSISAIADLPPVQAEDGTIVFPHRFQIAPDQSDQPAMYADTLNVAFRQFLQPAFAASGVQDGTDVLAGMKVSADVLATLNGTLSFNSDAALWWLAEKDVGEVPVQSQAQLKALASSLSAALGVAYRSYGEAVQADTPANNTAASTTDSAQATTATTQNGASASTSGTPTTGTGTGAATAGSVQNAYQDGAMSLSPVQKAIQPAMQALANDWAVVKTAIAAKRPDLLNQKWDFVTNNGTVQAVSNTLTAEQKSWLTGILNQNRSLISDTQTVNTQLVQFYQSNPLGEGTGADGLADVQLPGLTAQNIDGIIPFLALMAGVDPAALIRQGLVNEMRGFAQATPGYASSSPLTDGIRLST
jgi:hypothetical protein